MSAEGSLEYSLFWGWAVVTVVMFVFGCLTLGSVTKPGTYGYVKNYGDRHQIARLTLLAPVWPVGAVYLAVEYAAMLVQYARGIDPT